MSSCLVNQGHILFFCLLILLTEQKQYLYLLHYLELNPSYKSSIVKIGYVFRSDYGQFFYTDRRTKYVLDPRLKGHDVQLPSEFNRIKEELFPRKPVKILVRKGVVHKGKIIPIRSSIYIYCTIWS
jgi:hypothetical protein